MWQESANDHYADTDYYEGLSQWLDPNGTEMVTVDPSTWTPEQLAEFEEIMRIEGELGENESILDAGFDLEGLRASLFGLSNQHMAQAMMDEDYARSFNDEIAETEAQIAGLMLTVDAATAAKTQTEQALADCLAENPDC